MTAPAEARRTGPPVRWARYLLIAMHVSVVAVAVVFTALARPGDLSFGAAVLPTVLGLVVGALQLRHSLAAARGVAPRGAMWTLLALVAAVYVPLPWFGLNWGVTQTAVIASALMLLPARVRIAGVVVVLLAAATFATDQVSGRGSLGRLIYDVGGGVVFDAVVGVALYGAARLVRVLDELASARTELAELAVDSERLRVSRDLHDLLGQSLSAVSLKGDLAIRLLREDPGAAQAEIEGLTGVARDALRGVRAITLKEHAVSLRTETDGAAALLGAAGIRTQVVMDLPPLGGPVEAVFAWAVREGVTNVLRHSDATTCTLTAGHDADSYRLEIVNDGAGSSESNDGNGINGLTVRARELSGSVSHRRTAEGTFRLLVEVPRRSNDPSADR